MKDKKFVYGILIPCFILLFIFCVFPLFYGLGISLFDYNPIRQENPFIGLTNYAALLEDKDFQKALVHTIAYVVIAVTLNIIFTLAIARFITSLPGKKMKTLFRTIFFIPCIAPIAGTAVVWKNGLLYKDGGTFNEILGLFGLESVDWLASSVTVIGLHYPVYTLADMDIISYFSVPDWKESLRRLMRPLLLTERLRFRDLLRSSFLCLDGPLPLC